MRVVAISLLVLVFILSPAEASGIGLKSTLQNAAPRSVKLFKGLELYMWRVNGEPRWSMLMGTNRNKSEIEIHEKEETIDSYKELEKLLEKVAPAECIILINREKTAPPEKEIASIKALCQRLDLNFIGGTDSSRTKD